MTGIKARWILIILLEIFEGRAPLHLGHGPQIDILKPS